MVMFATEFWLSKNIVSHTVDTHFEDLMKVFASLYDFYFD